MGKPPIHSLSACSSCGATGDDFPSANVEAFEITGRLICDDCVGDMLASLADEGIGFEGEDYV